MEIKRDKVMELMKTYCEGNYNRFAREMGVDPAHLHRFLNTGVGGGKKIISGIIKFCREKNINEFDYFDI